MILKTVQELYINYNHEITGKYYIAIIIDNNQKAIQDIGVRVGLSRGGGWGKG